MNKSSKIKKTSDTDLIFDEIKLRISSGEWTYYQKIPSESDLADLFGVNRLTVRLALQKLNTLGILDTRVGDGTYVCAFDFEKHISDISEFNITPKLLDDVSEFRILIEIECARLAILRATQEDLEKLWQCAANYEEICNQFFDVHCNGQPNSKEQKYASQQIDNADIAFHSQICAMAHNDLLFYAYSIAKPAILKQMILIGRPRVPNVIVEGKNTSVQHHWDIYHAIENRDFETCHNLYMDMLNPSLTSPHPITTNSGDKM